MRKLISMPLVLICTQVIISQTIKDIPKDLLKKANTAANTSYLTNEEKKVILYMNIARIDGPWFVRNVLANEPDGIHTAKNLGSLTRTLFNTKNLPPFKPAKGLSKAATYHAKDMGKTGKTGHKSSDGTKTFVRIRKYAKGRALSENCSYGPSDAKSIVVQLLVDDGVPSLGHRNTILSKTYKYVGVAIEPHKIYGHNCVQDFSDTGD